MRAQVRLPASAQVAERAASACPDGLARADWLSIGLYTNRVKSVNSKKPQVDGLQYGLDWYDWLR